MEDEVLRRYVERTLHLAAEKCLDIANHIIAYEGYREPQSNSDCFQIHEQGIIELQLADRMKTMAQFRNIVVHDYLRIDPKIVYAVLKDNIPDIVLFAKQINDCYL
ncbi:MAG: DUF86 domain-containing protein [Limnochordia bacterium]|nr:DUF86 domain-containing protein [Limnochordia bacterium]